MPARSYCAARIDTSIDGGVVFRVIAVGVRATVAHRVQVHERSTNTILVCGDPHLRSTVIHLPPEMLATQAPLCLRETHARVTKWVDALRANGIVRLDVPGDGAIQQIPSAWLGDPLLQEILGRALTPISSLPEKDASALGPDWLDDAPATSIVGLLREPFAEVYVWGENLTDEAKRALSVPLFEVGHADNHIWRIGWWQRPKFRNPYSLGDSVAITLGDGAPRAALRPIGPAGGWTLAETGQAPVDSPWRWKGDVRLARLFPRLSALSERVFAFAANSRGLTGAALERELAGVAKLRRRLEPRLKKALEIPTAELRRRSGTHNIPAARLSHAVYLYADGYQALAGRRRQALDLWPTLASELASGKAPAAARAIDTGAPLAHALASDFGLAPWVVRRLIRLIGALPRLPPELLDLRTVGQLMAAAGPHAPPLRPADLEGLVRWLRFVPDCLGGWWSLRLMGHLGNQARRDGWDHAGAALEDDEDGGFGLLAWWHHLHGNVRDVLGHSLDNQVDDGPIGKVIAAWLADVPLAHALRMACASQMFVMQGMETGGALSADGEVPRPFEPVVLPHSGVRVVPLHSLAALREEGQAMSHCVASHWPAVLHGRCLLVSIHGTAGERATVSLRVGRAGNWRCVEARGPANRLVEPQGILACAIAEFQHLLEQGGILTPAASAVYREVANRPGNQVSDYLVQGVCIVSALPPNLVSAALRWMPGQGDLDARVRHAVRRAESAQSGRIARQSPGVITSSRRSQGM